MGEVVFLEKVFLKSRQSTKRLRGVELFNLWLLKDLASLGWKVIVPCHRSWTSCLPLRGTAKTAA